jgi:hypothetical protein
MQWPSKLSNHDFPKKNSKNCGCLNPQFVEQILKELIEVYINFKI